MASFNNNPNGANFVGPNGVPMQSAPNQQMMGQPSAPTFNPQQNAMLWTIPQQNQQPQGPRTIVDWVEGENGMQAYPLGPDTIAYLMDKTDSRFFVKITDKSGMPMSCRKFRFTEEIEGAKKYAKLAIETKLSHPDWSELFLEMSSAELDHAAKLYRMFTDEIGPLMEGLKEVPDYICEMFDSVIEYYSENYAEALHLHELCKSEVK